MKDELMHTDMVANATSPGTHVAGALVWLKSPQRRLIADPPGSLTIEYQERVTRSRARADGLTITSVLYGLDPGSETLDQRLRVLRDDLARIPIARLYATGAVLIDGADAEIERFSAELSRVGTDLIICDG
ncbi:hypothetical protein PYV02_06720 [Leifsonia sp. H3M29-4]|uniref:hypothetical protein n=1 Tax=Salinibacterium metalliresistens TaxID=3031321 RepID=UPI0023DC5760|nr:hypothetical protein [Salinibacterium metalliresistens]MDF1478776.1 hypothetical protein [Salinibacterium metalliresistens]